MSHQGETAAHQAPDELPTAVERFDHLALAVHDLRSVLPMTQLLGGEYRNGGRHPTAGFRWVQFTISGGVKLEVLSPVDPSDADNFLVRFLRDRGEGPHHVTFKVADVRKAVADFRNAGYNVVGESYEGPDWREAFVHPKSSHGLLIQLAQWDESLEPRHRSLAEVLGDAQ